MFSSILGKKHRAIGPKLVLPVAKRVFAIFKKVFKAALTAQSRNLRLKGKSVCCGEPVWVIWSEYDKIDRADFVIRGKRSVSIILPS